MPLQVSTVPLQVGMQSVSIFLMMIFFSKFVYVLRIVNSFFTVWVNFILFMLKIDFKCCIDY